LALKSPKLINEALLNSVVKSLTLLSILSKISINEYDDPSGVHKLYLRNNIGLIDVYRLFNTGLEF
jgi:hypothetical protein